MDGNNSVHPESDDYEDGVHSVPPESHPINVIIRNNKTRPSLSSGSVNHPPGFVEELPMNEASPVSESIGHNVDPSSLDNYFFADGVRRIDFVLVNKATQHFAEKFEKSRQIFEKNLADEGLQLETCQGSRGHSYLRFVKIHAPWEVLCRYAEILHFKMPVKPIQSWRLVMNFDQEHHPLKEEKFTATFRRDKEYMFHIPPQKETFFSSAQRSRIVDFILKRKSFAEGTNDAASLGIQKLIEDGAYEAAYPLHDGKISSLHQESPRMQLFNKWASFWHFFDYQPLDEIRKYMGVKVAMYFAWLGFYTSMLVPASMAGLACFIYSVMTYPSDKSSIKICRKKYNDVAMCPLCREVDCNYWLLSASCIDSFVAYLFDNPSTIFFAIFMAIWSTVFIEIWKRYSAQITYQWDISRLDHYEEIPRPEYLAKLDKCEKKRLNFITRMYEPYVPFWRKRIPSTILSASVILFFLSIALFILLGIVFYRVSVRATLSNDPQHPWARYSQLISSISASVINVILIVIFNWIHSKIAYKLTEMELPRTQTDFDNSLTLKLYLLQFVNYYSSLFYIAFFKGRFVSHPGDLLKEGLLKREQCGIGGCFIELTIQLAIILIGKQAIFGVWEMLWPWIEKQRNRKMFSFSHDETLHLPQWEADYLLTSWKSSALFYEYLEMILQFGLCTLFVVTFPLAPLFSLINNAFEIRLDARKFLCHYRRPVAIRVKSIGIWSEIIAALGRLSVLTSALIIAFTSNFIPKLYYYYKYGSLDDYIPWSLSYYDVKDLRQNLTAFITEYRLNLNSSEVCAYPGHYHPPGGPHEYQPTQEYWEILAYRLIFVVVFHNSTWMFNAFLRWIIPDVPRSLQEKIRQNTYLTNEFMIHQELQRAKELSDHATPES